MTGEGGGPAAPPPPLVVIVTGLPGAGKTTIARRLAQDLRFPLIAKDGLKEILFDALGWSDRDWSRRLGAATYPLIYHLLEVQLAAGCPLVVESNFGREHATGAIAVHPGFPQPGRAAVATWPIKVSNS